VSSRRSVGLDKAVLCEITTRKRLADRLSEAARVGVTVFAIAPPDRHSSLRLRHSMFIHVDELATYVEMKEAARNPDRTVAFLGARRGVGAREAQHNTPGASQLVRDAKSSQTLCVLYEMLA
jgi:hypothetical protein